MIRAFIRLSRMTVLNESGRRLQANQIQNFPIYRLV